MLLLIKPAHRILLTLDTYKRLCGKTLHWLERRALLGFVCRGSRFGRTQNTNVQEQRTELGLLLVLAHALPSVLGFLQVCFSLETRPRPPFLI